MFIILKEAMNGILAHPKQCCEQNQKVGSNEYASCYALTVTRKRERESKKRCPIYEMESISWTCHIWTNESNEIGNNMRNLFEHQNGTI